eukprot:GFKZ01009085.1.p1 GENE.GFKZ01009085.1~~GFKZ01009085.1.p1  ORF type:complete len:295 (-),score=-0.32 GFKZ01009085.1:623-1507(-)
MVVRKGNSSPTSPAKSSLQRPLQCSGPRSELTADALLSSSKLPVRPEHLGSRSSPPGSPRFLLPPPQLRKRMQARVHHSDNPAAPNPFFIKCVWEALREAFQRIHRDLNQASWHCATLPFTMGGLELTLTSSIYAAAHLFSMLSPYHIILDLLPADGRHLLTSAVRRTHSSLDQSLLPGHLQLKPQLARLHTVGPPQGVQPTITAAIHEQRLKAYLTSPPQHKTAAQRLVRNLSCRTRSANYPFLTLPDSRSSYSSLPRDLDVHGPTAPRQPGLQWPRPVSSISALPRSPPAHP